MRRLKYILYRKIPHLLTLLMLLAVSFAVGFYLPEKIPLHWDSHGVADRIGSKYELILLLPCASVIIFAAGIFTESRFILPSIKLRGLMSFIQFFFIIIIFIVQAAGLLRASGVYVPVERLMAIPAVLLFAYV